MKKIGQTEYWEWDDLAEMWGMKKENLKALSVRSKTIRNLPIPQPNKTRHGGQNVALWKKDRLGELNTWFNLVHGRRG